MNIEIDKEFKESNKEDTEKTLDLISISYNDTLYQKDLFKIFRLVTIYEKRMLCNELSGKDMNLLKMTFIKDLINFKVKYADSYSEFYEDDKENIKNIIITISILRKIHNIIKGECCTCRKFIGIKDVKDIKNISDIFNIILKMNKHI